MSNQEGVSAVITFTALGEKKLRELKTSRINIEKLDDVLGIQLRKTPQRKRSYNYVQKALIKNVPLREFDFISTLIELPDTLPQKFNIITNV